jgi:preprotein translocase subunit SecG
MMTILIILAVVIAIVLIGAYLVVRSAAQDINGDY